MTPLEVIGVIQRCSHHLNREITTEEIQSGALKTLLQPEDYLPLKDVSNIKLFTLELRTPFQISYPSSPLFGKV